MRSMRTAVALGILAGVVVGQETNLGSFEARRSAIRARYIAAASAGDVAAKKAAVAELEALDLEKRAADGPALRRGSEGETVRLLQSRLSSLGYDVAVDGDFGRRTEEAVRAYQRDRGLAVDGKAGKETWASIGRDVAADQPAAATEPSDAVVDADDGTRDVGDLTAPPAHPGLGVDVSDPGTGGAGRAPTVDGALLAGASGQGPTLRRGAIGDDVRNLQKRLNALGYDAGTADGIFGRRTDRAVRDFQGDRGLSSDGIAGPDTWASLAEEPGSTPPSAPSTPGEAVRLASLPFTPNSEALRRARQSSLGRNIRDRTAIYADDYRTASELTGVPAELIAAVHANESGMGSYRPSVRGPESGYGLDDRYVSTAWGNGHLARYGLGRWERGTDSARSRLQSAVVAAEHLKRQAGYAGITLDANMTRGELAGTVTSYIQGITAGKRARSNGRSWMFDTGDSNPHPLHPGGTSRTSSGTVRVAASRKPGLLRWDTALPLITEALSATP